MRASVSGTPQWLLKDFSAACVGPERRQAQAQHLLGAGLADAAGDGDDARVAARRAPRAPMASQPAQRIVDAQQRAVGRAARA